MKRFAAAMLLLAALPAAAQDRVSPMPRLMPLETEACFGRAYDAAHLAAHPKQRVTSFHLSREFESDPMREDEPTTPEEWKAMDGQNNSILVTAYVRFRNKRGVYSNGLSCHKVDDGGVLCGIDCDGGSFKLTEAGDALRLENNGFVVVGGCGASEDDQENTEHVSPGADDKVFRLDRKPVAACKAERDAMAPAFAKMGEPLRVRFAKAETTCFTRSYDDKHLAAHPKQTVKTISLRTKKHPDALAYNVTFRVTQKNGKTTEATSSCGSDAYAYLCTLPGVETALYLIRGGTSDIMLRDRKAVLPRLLNVKLGDDDKAFKLTQAPAAACE